jgi:hypothetical protein
MPGLVVLHRRHAQDGAVAPAGEGGKTSELYAERILHNMLFTWHPSSGDRIARLGSPVTPEEKAL